MANGSTVVAPVQANEMLNSSRVDLKKTINTFWALMARMIKDYADADSDLDLGNGFVIPAALKYEPGSATAFNDKIAKIEQMISTTLNVYDVMLKLEKSAGQL